MSQAITYEEFQAALKKVKAYEEQQARQRIGELTRRLRDAQPMMDKCRAEGIKISEYLR